jgi:dTDP-glucose pyrophosphorylase
VLTPLVPRRPVVVLAHGHGSRLAAVASGVHKTTEPVHGRAVLAWLLAEIRDSGTDGRTIVTVRTDDPELRAVVADSGLDVEVQVRQPGGYLRDVYDLSRTCTPRFTVVEADTLTYPGSLRNFLLLAERYGPMVDLCVGVGPASANPNGPAVTLTGDGRITAIRWPPAQPSGLVPLGAWHWTSRMLDDADAFARQSTSTADYVTWTVPRGALAVPIGFPAGFNINTPADLDTARHGVARWFDSEPAEPMPTQREDSSWRSHSSPARPA